MNMNQQEARDEEKEMNMELVDRTVGILIPSRVGLRVVRTDEGVAKDNQQHTHGCDDSE
jgi:hypothetical protein